MFLTSNRRDAEMQTLLQLFADQRIPLPEESVLEQIKKLLPIHRSPLDPVHFDLREQQVFLGWAGWASNNRSRVPLSSLQLGDELLNQITDIQSRGLTNLLECELNPSNGPLTFNREHSELTSKRPCSVTQDTVDAKAFVEQFLQKRPELRPQKETAKKRVCIIGAGSSGLIALNQFLKARENIEVKCFEELALPGGNQYQGFNWLNRLSKQKPNKHPEAYYHSALWSMRGDDLSKVSPLWNNQQRSLALKKFYLENELQEFVQCNTVVEDVRLTQNLTEE